MRRSLGVSVFSGMLGVTIFGVFLTPVFFAVIQGFGESKVFGKARTRKVVSGVLGIVLGAAIGYLFGRLGLMRPVWASTIGGVAGLLGVAMIPRRTFFPEDGTNRRRA